MVYYLISIAVCKSIEQRSTTMSNSCGLTDPCSKPRQINQLHKGRKPHGSVTQSSCDRSRSALIDIVIFIAVICASGFLLYPYITFAYVKTLEFSLPVLSLVEEEVYENPGIYGSLALSMVCTMLATWAILMYTSRKCANPYCKGLKKAAEFDIQLETEECGKNSSTLDNKNGVKKGMFELPRDHHRELEAELKKIAPMNGRAVLLFRARCGCSVGRIEVPGPRKAGKTKK